MINNAVACVGAAIAPYVTGKIMDMNGGNWSGYYTLLLALGALSLMFFLSAARYLKKIQKNGLDAQEESV